jgi:hypothetical protein
MSLCISARPTLLPHHSPRTSHFPLSRQSWTLPRAYRLRTTAVTPPLCVPRGRRSVSSRTPLCPSIFPLDRTATFLSPSLLWTQATQCRCLTAALPVHARAHRRVLLHSTNPFCSLRPPESCYTHRDWSHRGRPLPHPVRTIWSTSNIPLHLLEL